MLVPIFYVDGNAQKFETRGQINYSVSAPGAHIVLSHRYYWLLETFIINNHSVTAPSAQILLGGDDTESFQTPLKKIKCHCTKCPYFVTV